MMPKLMPVMLERVGEMIPMPDYMAEQMPDIMPKVMDNLMPHMIKDLVPLVTADDRLSSEWKRCWKRCSIGKKLKKISLFTCRSKNIRAYISGLFLK